MPLDGNFDVVKDLINPISWDYGPREVLPEMIEMEGDYEVLLKLYDVNEFSDIVNETVENEPVSADSTSK